MLSAVPAPDALSAVASADAHVRAGDWAAALALYEPMIAADPAQAAALALPLLAAHCRIELAGDPMHLDHGPLPAAAGSAREQQAVTLARARALELCRIGSTTRAAAILRLLVPYDPAMAHAYRHGFAPGRSAASLAPPDDRDPGFLRTPGIAGVSPDAAKRAHRGRRVLLVYRRFYPEGDPRRGEVINCLTISGERFGLDVTRFAFQGTQATEIAPALLRVILDLRPAVIVYDTQYPYGMSQEPEATREQIEAVLAMTRQQLGVRIVASYMDIWEHREAGPDAMFRGLGETYDLIQHTHPGALEAGTPAQNAATFCCMLPAWVPAPSVAYGTVPRACFVGGISWFNVARLAWWAETGCRALPIDFFETRHVDGAVRTDEAYVDLFAQHQLAINFTRRSAGTMITTGRTLDIPLAGGVLLEEASVDAAFFLKPGIHYVPFTTLDDLAALIPELLADAPRRERLRTAARQWVETYFTGDYFWAGILTRLWP